MKTDTPETDANRYDPIQRDHMGDSLGEMQKCDDGYWIPSDLCEKLERERDEARRSRTVAVEKYQAAVKEMHEAGQQRDEYAAMLCEAMRWVYQAYDSKDFIRKFEALELTPQL